MERQKVTHRVAEDCGTPFSLLLVRLNAVLSGRCDPSRTPFSNLEWIQSELLINTVNGITVLGMMGRSGLHPDAPPTEVSQPCKVKIPQREKYRRN